MLFGAIWLCAQGELVRDSVGGGGGAVIMLFGAIWLCTQGENWYGVVLGGGQSSCCLELSGCENWYGVVLEGAVTMLFGGSVGGGQKIKKVSVKIHLIFIQLYHRPILNI